MAEQCQELGLSCSGGPGYFAYHGGFTPCGPLGGNGGIGMTVVGSLIMTGCLTRVTMLVKDYSTYRRLQGMRAVGSYWMLLS